VYLSKRLADKPFFHDLFHHFAQGCGQTVDNFSFTLRRDPSQPGSIGTLPSEQFQSYSKKETYQAQERST
jgi:hypothetical protein